MNTFMHIVVVSAAILLVIEILFALLAIACAIYDKLRDGEPIIQQETVIAVLVGLVAVVSLGSILWLVFHPG